jgi:hypothetical protein
LSSTLQAVAADRFTPLLFRVQPGDEPIALRRLEPVGFRRPVGHVQPKSHAEDNGWHRFHDEQPLPSRNTEPSIQVEQLA